MASQNNQVPRQWVIDNFHLDKNAILDKNPVVREQLIQVLQKNAYILEGSAQKDEFIIQKVAG